MRIAPVLPFLAAAAAAQSPTALSYPQLLLRLVDRDWLWTPPAAGERCVQFSSYDRRSDAGPAHPDDWYANGDRGHYLRVEERDGHKEYVLADADGPGCIARIWSANPAGVLQFDVDGERVWTVDFAQLCSGRLAGVPEPLAGVRARGANCHLPIPFRRHLRLSSSQGDLYYHVDVVHFPAGTEVPGFSPALLAEQRARIAEAAAALQQEPPAPAGGGLPERCWRVAVPGPSLVREVALEVAPRQADVDLGALLRAVLLVVRCGGEETVRVPVLDFFGGGADWRPHHGALLGCDRVAWCRWPMPMPEGGSVELVADAGDGSGDIAGEIDARVRLRLAVARTGTTFPQPPLLLRASYHLRKGFPSRPFHDHLVLDASGGPGRYVGCALLVKNPHRAWWGEGDEKFYVDGESFPSTFGTGTEDYFGYAWCCPQTFSSAFHAQAQCDGPGNRGFTAVHRMQVLDSVPFQRTFRFDLEVWHWVGGLRLDYATVAFWYGAAGASAGLPPVPPAAARTLDRLPPPRIFAVAGALEGEGLRVVSCSGGRHEVQEMSFVEAAFSHDAQRWWMDGKPGDALVLAVPVAAAGRYRVRAAFCRADDYGIVQCSLAGHALGAPIDLYAPKVSPSGVLDLGVADLQQGEAELRLELTGRNERAKPRFMVGLDYLLLEPVR